MCTSDEDKLREYERKIEEIKDILRVKTMASNAKVAMIETVLREHHESN